jgi:hypothetical protein
MEELVAFARLVTYLVHFPTHQVVIIINAFNAAGALTH